MSKNYSKHASLKPDFLVLNFVRNQLHASYLNSPTSLLRGGIYRFLTAKSPLCQGRTASGNPVKKVWRRCQLKLLTSKSLALLPLRQFFWLFHHHFSGTAEDKKTWGACSLIEVLLIKQVFFLPLQSLVVWGQGRIAPWSVDSFIRFPVLPGLTLPFVLILHCFTQNFGWESCVKSLPAFISHIYQTNLTSCQNKTCLKCANGNHKFSFQWHQWSATLFDTLPFLKPALVVSWVIG